MDYTATGSQTQMSMHALTMGQISKWFKQRPQNSNKGDFGRVLIIGGDYGMPGAVRIAAEAAARIGAGLVTVITRPEHVASTVSMHPEILCYGVYDISLFSDLIERATVIVLGPGLGQSDWSKQFIDPVLNCNKPLLVDADGLNLLASMGAAQSNRENWILTPHPGEAARLLGLTVGEIQSDRVQSCLDLYNHYGGVIVLKGHHTLIATKNSPLVYCPAGNPGMSSAGMGDSLRGMISGLVAQGLELAHAAQSGVLLHATAGDRAAKQRSQFGLLASDLLSELPALLNDLVMPI